MYRLTALSQRLESITFTILLTLIISVILPGVTWVTGLGIDNGHLISCPASDNCVVSQNADANQLLIM
jgi:uncharacterized protein (DUF1499 family)